MTRFHVALFSIAIGLSLQLAPNAAAQIYNFQSSGAGISVTNSPGWFTNSQSIAVGDYNTNLTVSASNGVYCSLFLTNALTSNVTVTLDFAAMGAPLTPLWLQAVCSNSISGTVLYFHNEVVLTDAGDENANQTYQYDATVQWPDSGIIGAFTNAVNTYQIARHVAFGGKWFIGDSASPSELYEGPEDLSVTNTWTVVSGTGPAPTVTGIGEATNQRIINGSTNIYALAWSANCAAENGSVRALADGTNSYFITHHLGTNIVTWATNLTTIVSPP